MTIKIKTIEENHEHKVAPGNSVFCTNVGETRPCLEIKVGKDEVEVVINPWRWTKRWDDEMQEVSEKLTTLLQSKL